jgi:hypothetical protein
MPRQPVDPDLVMKAMYIRREQDDFLRWRSFRKRQSQAATIREALDSLIDKERAEWSKDKS